MSRGLGDVYKRQEYIDKNIKTVQFHPEACAGPLDTDALFDEFEKMMEGK